MAERKGTAFENETAEKYGFTWTVNSGARDGDGDLRHDGGRFIVECKNDLRFEGISIPGGDLKKMDQQADLFGDGNWVRLVRRRNGKVVACMNDGLFAKLLSVADGKIVCPTCETRIQPDW